MRPFFIELAFVEKFLLILSETVLNMFKLIKEIGFESAENDTEILEPVRSSENFASIFKKRKFDE